jgi:hypothetical protein
MLWVCNPVLPHVVMWPWSSVFSSISGPDFLTCHGPLARTTVSSHCLLQGVGVRGWATQTSLWPPAHSHLACVIVLCLQRVSCLGTALLGSALQMSCVTCLDRLFLTMCYCGIPNTGPSMAADLSFGSTTLSLQCPAVTLEFYDCQHQVEGLSGGREWAVSLWRRMEHFIISCHYWTVLITRLSTTRSHLIKTAPILKIYNLIWDTILAS